MVNHVGSMKEWGTLMETSKEKLVVVDFTATWCVIIVIVVDLDSLFIRFRYK